ncbi:uncharacterized protein ACA1_384210, partial [Acanthamoeba castellanii str. Neff]
PPPPVRSRCDRLHVAHPQPPHSILRCYSAEQLWSVDGRFGHFWLLPGRIGPAIYELSAELLYPVPEATSGGLMVLLINIATLIFLFVSPLITTTWINTIQMLTMVGCFIMVVFVNERYKRWEAEMAIYHEKPQLSHPPPPLGLNVQE